MQFFSRKVLLYEIKVVILHKIWNDNSIIGEYGN